MHKPEGNEHSFRHHQNPHCKYCNWRSACESSSQKAKYAQHVPWWRVCAVWAVDSATTCPRYSSVATLFCWWCWRCLQSQAMVLAVDWPGLCVALWIQLAAPPRCHLHFGYSQPLDAGQGHWSQLHASSNGCTWWRALQTVISWLVTSNTWIRQLLCKHHGDANFTCLNHGIGWDDGARCKINAFAHHVFAQ